MTREERSEEWLIEAMEQLDRYANVVDAQIVSVPVVLLRILRDFLADAQAQINFLREFCIVTEMELRETRRVAREQGCKLPVPEPGSGRGDQSRPV